MSVPATYGYTLDVLPGGQITLTARFGTYVGSDVPADVSGLTITITPAAGNAAVVGPTAIGITHASTGVYTYTWAVGAATIPGDYTVLWAATGPSGPVTTGVVVTVAQSPSESPAPGVYATVTQYRKYTLDQATPDTALAMWLQIASEDLDTFLVGAVYKTDDDNMPTDATVLDIFMRACCRQAQYEMANNDPALVKDQYSSTNVGGVSLTRAQGTTAKSLPPLAPRAAAILRTAGALGTAPLLGW